MLRAAKHAKLVFACSAWSWMQPLQQSVCSLACSIPSQLSVPGLKQLNFKLLNHGHWKTNPNTLSKGMPRQPCLANNKPWWRRRTCLSGWLSAEWNDLLQPSKQGHSEMGTKGRPSGSQAAPQQWGEWSFKREHWREAWLTCSTKHLAGIILFLQTGVQIHT